MTEDASEPSWFRRLIGSAAGRIGAGALTLVGGALALVFGPLQADIADRIWPEDIHVVPNTLQVVEGQAAPLSVTLLNRSRGALPSGAVTIASQNEAISLTGNPVISFSKLDGTMTLTSTPPLQVTARTFGIQHLSVSVATTRRRTFSGDIVVNATAKKQVTSARDITGNYDIVLNGAEGSMDIRDRAETRRRVFSGQAAFDDGRAYAVTGWRDGTVFHVEFTKDGQKAFWAEGLYCTKTHDDAKWMIVNAKVISYPPDPGARAQSKSTIREACPGYPKDMVATPGDGRLFASVSLD